MGLADDDAGASAYVAVHDDDGCHDCVRLTAASSASWSAVLQGPEPTALTGDVIAALAGAAGGTLVLRRAVRGDVTVSVAPPGGAPRSSTYVRRGVVHMANAVAHGLGHDA